MLEMQSRLLWLNVRSLLVPTFRPASARGSRHQRTQTCSFAPSSCPLAHLQNVIQEMQTAARSYERNSAYSTLQDLKKFLNLILFINAPGSLALKKL